MADQGNVFLLPPRADRCQTCGSKHEPSDPHNAHSIYYQTAFLIQHGRAANWIDAMEHCEQGVRDIWVEALGNHGIDALAGEVFPPRKEAAARG